MCVLLLLGDLVHRSRPPSSARHEQGSKELEIARRELGEARAELELQQCTHAAALRKIQTALDRRVADR